MAAHEQAGNTIDFFVQVLGLSFHEAMRIITAASGPPHQTPQNG
jgi:hypothetical protein